MPKRVAANSILALCSITIGLVLGESVSRLFVVALHRPPIVVSDEHAGWQGKARLHHVLKSYGNGQFTISTDSHGHRITYTEAELPPTGVSTVLLLGDSFVQGVGVADDETFSWHLARALPYHIVNLGVAGYGTDQELLKLEEFFSANPTPSVESIVVLLFDNDFVEVQRAYDPYLGRSKPQFTIDGGVLVRGNYVLPWWDRLMDASYLFWIFKSKLSIQFAPPQPSGETGVALVEACLGEIRKLADARGIPLHIVAHRRLQGSFPLPESSWTRFLEHTGAVDITEPMRMALGSDAVGFDGVHWSAEGHRWVASLLEVEFTRHQ